MTKEMERTVLARAERVMKRKGLQVQAVEATMNLSQGYLSRVRNGKKPLSDKLLFALASALGVSVEYLLCDDTEENADDRELRDFFETVFNMTANNDVYWRVVPEDRIGEEGLEPGEPIFQEILIDPEDAERLGYKVEDPYEYVRDDVLGARSLRMGHEIDGQVFTKISFVHSEAWATIESINSKLFLYCVDYETEDGKQHINDVVEAYLVSGKGQHFLCSSAWASPYLSSKLKAMYQLAFDQASGPRLDENARKLIKRFNTQNERKNENEK